MHHAVHPGPQQWHPQPLGRAPRPGAPPGTGRQLQGGWNYQGTAIQPGAPVNTIGWQPGYGYQAMQPMQCSSKINNNSSVGIVQDYHNASVVANNHSVDQTLGKDGREQAAHALLALANEQATAVHSEPIDLRYKIQRSQDQDKAKPLLQEIEGFKARIHNLEFRLLHTGVAIGELQHELELLKGERGHWNSKKYFSLSQGQWQRPTEHQKEGSLLDLRPTNKAKVKKKPWNKKPRNHRQQKPVAENPKPAGTSGQPTPEATKTQSSSDSTSTGTDEVSSSDDNAGPDRSSESADKVSTEGQGRIEPPVSPTFDDFVHLAGIDLDDSVRELLSQ